MDIHHVDVVVKALKHYNALPEDWETYQLCHQTAQSMALSFNALLKIVKVSKYNDVHTF